MRLCLGAGGVELDRTWVMEAVDDGHGQLITPYVGRPASVPSDLLQGDRANEKLLFGNPPRILPKEKDTWMTAFILTAWP